MLTEQEHDEVVQLVKNYYNDSVFDYDDKKQFVRLNDHIGFGQNMLIYRGDSGKYMIVIQDIDFDQDNLYIKFENFNHLKQKLNQIFLQREDLI